MKGDSEADGSKGDHYSAKGEDSEDTFCDISCAAYRRSGTTTENGLWVHPTAIEEEKWSRRTGKISGEEKNIHGERQNVRQGNNG